MGLYVLLKQNALEAKVKPPEENGLKKMVQILLNDKYRIIARRWEQNQAGNSSYSRLQS